MQTRWKWISLAFVSLTLIAVAVAYGAMKTGGPEPVTVTENSDRQEVYNEMKSMMGTVPGFFKTIPDVSLEAEWNAFKAVEAGPGSIPPKYRELIGVAVSAARACEYCTYYHTQFARLHGATDQELASAAQLSKTTMGWSTYLYGTQYPMDKFEEHIDNIIEYHQSTESASR